MSKSLESLQAVLAKADLVGFKKLTDASQVQAGATKLGLGKPGTLD